MAKLAIIDERDIAPEASYEGVFRVSDVISAKSLSPAEYSLQLTLLHVASGAVLEWDADHGDEALYLLSGEVEVNGSLCPTGGAVIVESGVPAKATARSEARLVYCRPSSHDAPENGLYGPPAPYGHGVHVVGDGGWLVSGDREHVKATWFADSTCPTCRISLFRVDHEPGFAGNFHSHSQDEIIFVLNGTVQLGPRGYGEGVALNIPGNVPYRVSYPEGADFLNFRRDVSEQRTGKDGAPQLEGALARGGKLVGDFR